MAWPAGRRTQHVTVYLSAAELALWEAIRSTEVFPPSRADMIMEWLIPLAEELAASDRREDVRRRLTAALDAIDPNISMADRLYHGRIRRLPRKPVSPGS